MEILSGLVESDLFRVQEGNELLMNFFSLYQETKLSM